MSQAYKEPPNYFGIRFCSMGCNDSQTQNEISGSQVGALQMLQKINEKQMRQQINLNDSKESDMLDGLSEKLDDSLQKKDFVQPSLTQKNTLSSLKMKGNLQSSQQSRLNNNDTFKPYQYQNDLQIQEQMVSQQNQPMQFQQGQQPLARVLGYEYSENAESGEDEDIQKYHYENENIVKRFEQRFQADKNASLLNKDISQNQQNMENTNQFIQFLQESQQQDNLESSERFNAQNFSSRNTNYNSKKDQLNQFISQDPSFKNLQEEQIISPRFTEDTAFINNAQLQKILQQKIDQDLLLIDQIKNQNNQQLAYNYAQYQNAASLNSQNFTQQNPQEQQSQQQQQQLQQLQIITDGQDIQDKYSQMMNGVCISKRSEQSINSDDQNQYLEKVAGDINNLSQNIQKQKFLRAQNSLQNINLKQNSLNQIQNFQRNNSYDRSQQLQDEKNIYPQNFQTISQLNQQKQNQKFNVNSQGQQMYQIPQGYEVVNINSYQSEKVSFQSEAQQIKQQEGDRPITVESSHGTEYTSYSQRNLSKTLNNPNSNNNAKLLNSLPTTNNPLNSYLFLNSAPLENQSQLSNLRDQEISEDIKCNYSQSINEINPVDQEQQAKHYLLHQHDKKKKRDLVSDSHLFNSFNNTNFFQNQTIQNNSVLQNSNLNQSNQGMNTLHKNSQNRVVNLSTNSEVHEYSKSKTPLNEIPVTPSHVNNFTSYVVLKEQNNQKNDNHENDDHDAQDINRDSIYSNNTHQGSSVQQGQIDMSHIMKKVKDIQGQEQKEFQQNQVMLNSFNTQSIPLASINNYTSINQYASINQNGNYDTARTVSQVNLNSHHFYDAISSNQQLNQVTTLTNSIDGRKKSECVLTPKNQKNGIISSNPNLYSQYTFKQSDTPDPYSKELNTIQLSNQIQNVIQETDRALEQTILDQNSNNKNNLALSLSPENEQNLFMQDQQNLNLQTMKENTEDSRIPDDENKHYIHEGSIDIDPSYKLSPKVKSQSSLSNNQIFNENALKNLINSIQQLSNHSSNNPSKQLQEISQYQTNKELNVTQNEKLQYGSQVSSRQTSPFSKPSLYLEKLEQISSPIVIDPSPKYTDQNSLSQLSMKANSFREEKTKQSGRQNSQILNNTNQELLDKQRIEAALMNKDDETEDNQKLIQIIQQTEQMQQQLYSQQQDPVKKAQNTHNNYNLQKNHEIEEKMFEHININKANQSSVQSSENNYNNQYYNAQYSNQAQNLMMNHPSKQYENTPNFENSDQSNQNANQFNSKYNQNQAYQAPSSFQLSRSQDQDRSQYQSISYTQRHDRHQLPVNNNLINQPNQIQQNIQNNFQNQYFLNPDYQIDNQGSVINRDNSKNLSQASSIRLNKSLQQKLNENNQDWSQNNDGTIIFTRDGLEFTNFESTNENQFLNSSKMQRESHHPLSSQFEQSQKPSLQQNKSNQPQSQQSEIQSKQFSNQQDHQYQEQNFEKVSPDVQKKNRSPSPVQIKMTKSSELKYQVSQERIKQLNEKVQKKKDLVNQREQEFQKRIEEKGQKQENQVKEQNKQLRIQNLRLKEQNELLKKQMECIINVNQNVNTIQSSLNGFNSTSTNKQFDSAVASSRLNSTPLKNSQKSPVKNQKFSFKMKSPSLHQLNNSSYHSLTKSNVAQATLPVISIQMNLNSNQTTYQDLDNHQKNGQNIPVNFLLNQSKSIQNSKTNTPNNNTFYVDISKTLQQTKKSNQDIISKDLSSIKSNNNHFISNYESQKSSMFDLNNQDHPQINYSPKNIYDYDSNTDYQSNNPQLQYNSQNQMAPITVQHLVHEDPQINNNYSQFNHLDNELITQNNHSQKFIEQSSGNQEQFNHQMIPTFSKVSQQSKLLDSYGNNSLGDNYTNTKDTFQQNSPEQQLKVSGKHFRSFSTAAVNQTKSSISSKPQNQLFDSKNSIGFDNLQPYINESQKQNQNESDMKASEGMNRQIEQNYVKKQQNNQLYSSKESQNGNYNTNNSRSQYQSYSTANTARKNEMSKKQNIDENKSKNEYIMSAHLDNKKNSQQALKQIGGIREKVDQELKKSNITGKYKLVQNIDNTYSLMQKNTKQPLQPNQISSSELTKNQYKNNFMPRQYNPEEFKKKSKNEYKSQENQVQIQLNQQQAKGMLPDQNEPIKEPLKLVIMPQIENSISPNQISNISDQSKQLQNERSQISTFQKKNSSPSLTLPKTNSNLSIGLKSHRSIQQNTAVELSSNFIPQNMSNISNNSKNLSQISHNQFNNVPSQSQINSQYNTNTAQTTYRSNTNKQNEDTNYLINNAMSSIFQKIENCYDNIQAGYDESVSALKKETK
ncbi:endo-1,4-beta-xylanase xylA, putative (macronuclear) [Tetrahymena thermophila SB210]|uniref:Endo-1,4-beta-xylanase xylA, putative n=1 Tax=Tetrahymena thermophila (strain SB210) TaxID=312017 RepID=I7MJH8_TETTS|nr:endo-1,4-beta-xylanase xylA, putative [Tetrahymena thermophila SB210]EAR96365.1 endo-1,4-beta-xylanase xylA, putative [Tetrahymena thermophila SB210]|eukprot:XP_001016610.1 endo-1,4-beta-xylanase xylA, putative [Tetrahymena thermophila SB210]